MATIVIDPGHGGPARIDNSSANNATGPAGTLEKTLTLRLALLLRDKLATGSHTVVLTRTEDVNLSLEDRAAFARSRNAPAFLSLHFNGDSRPSIQGSETWLHTNHNAASQQLASRVQSGLLRATQLRDRGVKRNRLGVISPAFHASVTAACLTEVSFLTDPTEEARLRTGSYLDRIADSLALALVGFVELQPLAIGRLYQPQDVGGLMSFGEEEFEDGLSVERVLEHP
jgi:N-acetylmuramoyl-L-alanine amidase